jgi:hypothetical protein
MDLKEGGECRVHRRGPVYYGVPYCNSIQYDDEGLFSLRDVTGE